LIHILEIISSEYKSSGTFFLILLHDWAKLQIERSDTLYIFGKFSKNSNSLILRNLREPKLFSETDFAVLCPDEKISVTELTSKSDCLRSTTLNKFFETYDQYGRPAIEGRVHHNVFEEIINKRKQAQVTEREKKHIIEKHLSGWDLEVLYYLKADYKVLYNSLMTAIGETNTFKNKFIGADCPIHDSQADDLRLTIRAVESTEKRLESNKFGLIGIIDAVTRCSVYFYSENKEITVSIPFELKAGQKVQHFYHGQVLLYLMMMYENDLAAAERYPGILYYNNLGKLEIVKVGKNEFYDLMMRRNQVVKRIIDMKTQIQKKEFKLVKRIKNLICCVYCNVSRYCAAIDVSKKSISKYLGQPLDSGDQVIIWSNKKKPLGVGAMVGKSDSKAAPGFGTGGKIRQSMGMSKSQHVQGSMGKGGAMILEKGLGKKRGEIEKSEIADMSTLCDIEDVITEAEPEFDD
jgi:hypothetical protein